MSLLAHFFTKKKSSAAVAKERLQIIVAHERGQRPRQPDFLPKLQQEILQVISKYVSIDTNKVKVQLDKHADGDMEVLELNITLPEGDRN